MVAELGDARSRLGYLQKVSAWQEVARRLAHEIKNPLTPIQLAVQELGSKYRGDDRRIPAAAGDGAGDPERGGRRDPPPGRRLLGVRQAAQGRAGAGRSRAGRRGLRARPPRVAGLPEGRPQRTASGALCDRMLMRNVLANLVENAVQAAEAAGRKPEIRIAVAPSLAERGARLTVDDNGPGVPADARERIFDPYVTTKEHGTGLGLAIVRKIVLDHGGDVHVDDQRVAARRRALRGHPADRGGSTIDWPASRSSGRPSASVMQVAEHGGGGGGEPRLEAAAAHPGAQHAGVVDGQRRRDPAAPRCRRTARGGRSPSAIDARRARDQRRVRDVLQVGEAALVQPQHVARRRAAAADRASETGRASAPRARPRRPRG